MENFKTITNAEVAAGFINEEVVDFENSIMTGQNKTAERDAYAYLYDIFAEYDFQ